MYAPPMTPSIEVTIGRESRLYHAFITTAPQGSTRRPPSRSTPGRFRRVGNGCEPDPLSNRADALRRGSWTAPSWPGSARGIANGAISARP
jgi:hypothetical protein